MEEQFFEMISQAISEMNEDLEYDNLRNVTRETEIFGGENSIDSISLASLITEIEFLIREKLALNVVLADEKAMSMKNSPYRNVGALLNLIAGKLEDDNG